MGRKGALILIAFLYGLFESAKTTCPSQPWNRRCQKCCEPGWLACMCPSTAEMTGYYVPCCRQETLCTPCVEYPGCDVFSNCKTCLTGSQDIFQPFTGGRKYCSSCERGWSGSQCKHCGGTLREIRGSIEIVKYPENIECVWTIHVDENALIELRFERFEIENDPQCGYDKLTIFDGPMDLNADKINHCGNALPKRFISKTNIIVLQFKSDETTNFGGFHATYRSLNACARRPCKHGGACVLTDSGNFVCMCRRGYSGSLCENVARCQLGAMTFNLTYKVDNELLEIGTKVTFICDKGFFHSGTKLATCRSGGKWSHPPPKCTNACPQLTPPNHGKISGALALFGAKTLYSCEAGYQLIGPLKRTCTKQRKWTGDTPLCVFQSGCLDPGVPSFGYRTISPGNSSTSSTELSEFASTGIFPYFSSIIHGCDEQYLLTGSSIRVCLENGSFSGNEVVCELEVVEVECGPLEPGPGQVITTYFDGQPTEVDVDFTKTHKVGTLAEVTCYPELGGRRFMHQRFCRENGTWSGVASDPKCVNGSKCPVLPPLRGGRMHIHLPPDRTRIGNVTTSNILEHTNFPMDTTVTFSCLNPGEYVLAGSSIRVCRPGGTWSGTRPFCVKGCEDPGIPPHLKRDEWIGPSSKPRKKDRSSFLTLQRQLPYGFLPKNTVLLYECISTDFFFRGIQKRVCLSSGKWSTEDPPRCIPRCGVLPRPTFNEGHSSVFPPSVFPWHAVIKLKDRANGAFSIKCGGAYIGHNLVITVAQCVTFSSTTLSYIAADLRVELGKQQDNKLAYNYSVSEIIIHSDFDPILHDYDLAMLVISAGIVIPKDKSVWPVCLSGDTEFMAPRSRMIAIGERGVASTWRKRNATNQSTDLARAKRFSNDTNTGDMKQTLVDKIKTRAVNTPPRHQSSVVYSAMRNEKLEFDSSNDYQYSVEEIKNDSEPMRHNARINSTLKTIQSSHKLDYSTQNFSTTKASLTTRAPTSSQFVSEDNLISINLIREHHVKCEKVFRLKVTRSRMLCGVQYPNSFPPKVTTPISNEPKCIEKKGNPLVVMRNVRYRTNRRRRARKRKRRARKRKWRVKRGSTQNFNPFFVGKKLENTVPLTSYQQISVVRKIVKPAVVVPPKPITTEAPVVNITQTKPINTRPKTKRKKAALPRKAWVLDGLSSWNLYTNCVESSPTQYIVFTKLKYYIPWVKRKRDQLKLKKLLIPST